MLNQFKCFSRPHRIACVDDDLDFLELLTMALPKAWNVSCFSKTHTFIDFIHQNTALAKRDFSLLNKVFQDSNYLENPLANMIRYWRDNPQRWLACDVGILDFSMPKMSGLDVLRELPNWQGIRLLLTGVADEKIAVQAFNQMLIHQYLPKQSDNVVDKLKAALHALRHQLHIHQQQLIQNQLNDEQLRMLRHESVAHALTAFANEHWIEYVVLGNPFGVLGLSATGQLSWLQLERSCEIEDLKNIANSENWDANTLQAIHEGSVLPNSLLRQALGNTIALAASPLMPFGTNDLIGAFFEFEAPLSMRANGTYKEWFAANSSRLIQD
jgi:CheY-like chemotaxis protein